MVPLIAGSESFGIDISSLNTIITVPKSDDLPVNPTKEKHLTNHRSSGDGKGIQLSPPLKFSLERAIEYISADELVEATPKNVRLRKRILSATERKRQARKVVSD